GYLLGQRSIIDKLKNFQPPWALSAYANSVAKSVAQSGAFIQKTLVKTNRTRSKFKASLHGLGVFVYESCANYLLVDLKPVEITAREMAEALNPFQILIRNCENYTGLDDYYVRLAVKSEEDNQVLIDTLKRILKGKK
ncbi:MAG: aminotransferase class I/II-fold pyridoxal phosphate-dependent enzyme, partial [Clostridia bacterium]|nr:aminotransferase class I/II-fold pyridoxal phosphate-dependent enzyme [Clostridia bacterium]